MQPLTLVRLSGTGDREALTGVKILSIWSIVKNQRIDVVVLQRPSLRARHPGLASTHWEKPTKYPRYRESSAGDRRTVLPVTDDDSRTC